MKSSIIFPVSLEFWYRMNPVVDLGFIAGVQGNQYHGNPDKYIVDNPQLRYSVTTVGPAANIRLHKLFKFRVDAGFNFLRRFEFFDGNDKARSLNLENAGFVRIGLQLGAGD